MADWIKMTVKLRTHPKVVRIASALKADKLRVLGALYCVWTVFDQHSADGRLDGYTVRSMDEEIGWKGFAAAMVAVGWLGCDEQGLFAPEFDEHNSKSAKRRALDTDRKKSAREADETANGSWTASGQMSASDADKTRTREEQIRRELPSVVERERARPAKKCPDSFVVTPELTEWARVNAPGISVQRETERFRDHTFSTARTDWPGTWRNWMRKAAESGVRPRGGDEVFAGAH